MSKRIDKRMEDTRAWKWLSLAADGSEYAQARLADALGWDGDNDQLAKVGEAGNNARGEYVDIDIEIDGSVYASYRLHR